MLNEEIKQAKALLTNLYLELKIKKEYNQELIEDKIEQEKKFIKKFINYRYDKFYFKLFQLFIKLTKYR